MQKAIIIGAGPAGLTAAYELLTRSNIKPIVLEKDELVGGISRTVNHNGNRIDIGGHRFFSKSDRVMRWWLNHLPMQRLAADDRDSLQIKYHHQSHELQVCQNGPDPDFCDQVMLVRKRKSRIYCLGTFFDYPISLSTHTLRKLGARRAMRIIGSYVYALIFPPKQIDNLEQFLISRFGRELYETFFKSYTEKVWGVPCTEISAEWGAQRIQGLSITKAVGHVLKKKIRLYNRGELAQKAMETSLIERFLYPKFGPGQMWETVALKVKELGGDILTNMDVQALQCQGNEIRSVKAIDHHGTAAEFAGDYFFSTMPIQELVQALDLNVPSRVEKISGGLQYRDFITVGLLLKRLTIRGTSYEQTDNDACSAPLNTLVEDNWIYIQEPGVLAGRLQIFNNWSPYLVSRPDHIWIGVEYFCRQGDGLWAKPDSELIGFACQELRKIGIIDGDAVLDATVIRMPKSYPAYVGTYAHFSEVRAYLDGFSNLFLIGRNGMHKYNNQDHSMLTAMEAVDNIVMQRSDKSNIWEVNTEMEYHEIKPART